MSPLRIIGGICIALGFLLTLAPAFFVFTGYHDVLSRVEIPIVVVGALLIPIGFVIFFVDVFRGIAGAFGARKIPADAVIGYAAITQVEPTGTLINDVRVYKLHATVVDSELREFSGVLHIPVPEHQIHMLTPGFELAVAYGPKNPSQLFLPNKKASREHAEAIGLNWKVARCLVPASRAAIREHGITVDGMVLHVTPTGEVRYGHTGLQVGVRFTRHNHPGDYLDRHTLVFLRPQQVRLLQVGAQVEVMYLPENDSEIAISMPQH